jgi:prepilin-type N-terminal cleavage/methylation domain-containing protein
VPVKRRRGFTIIELLVTIAIFGFVIALALPMYRSYTTAWACRNAAQILYSDLVLQRQKAFALCQPTGVTVNENGTYGLWEIYNTGAELPPQPEEPAAGISSPVGVICAFLLSFVPVGCNKLIEPVHSPLSSRITRTVCLTRDLAVPINLVSSRSFIYFVPLRSDYKAKWSYCNCSGGDITVASGAETIVITVTDIGDIVLN